MLKRNLAVAGVSLAMAVWAPVASMPATAAIVPAVSVSGTPDPPAAGTEQGWEFDTNSGIIINALGVFDQVPDGLTDSHLVSLWDVSDPMSDPSQITSATVPSGISTTLFNGFRYVSISPVTLASGGTFVISAFYPSNGDGVLALAGGIMSVSEITVTDGRVGFSAGFPSDAIDTTARFGPNFSFSVIPLPAALPLFLSALAGLGVFGWRRRMKAGA